MRLAKIWAFAVGCSAACIGCGDGGAEGNGSAVPVAAQRRERPTTPTRPAPTADDGSPAAGSASLAKSFSDHALAPATIHLDGALIAEDSATFAALAAVPVGQTTSWEHASMQDPETWANMGFVAAPSDPGSPQARRYRREVDLLSLPEEMVLTDLPAISEVDCVAISSIDRRNGEAPYIYTTLRSIFDVFPAGVQVNVLVGNADTDYLSREVLAEQIGEANVAAVHVLPTSEEVGAYLRQRLPANRRGGWNYTRALRAYPGRRGLIMMEDDVIWTRGGVERFNAALRPKLLPAATLYNYHCSNVPGFSAARHRADSLSILEVKPEEFDFYCLQGMYYSHAISAALGRYTLKRMHTKVYDNVIGYFLAHNRATIGYLYPSIVQHIGQQTSCDSWEFLQSRCFVEDLSSSGR